MKGLKYKLCVEKNKNLMAESYEYFCYFLSMIFFIYEIIQKQTKNITYSYF